MILLIAKKRELYWQQRIVRHKFMLTAGLDREANLVAVTPFLFNSQVPNLNPDNHSDLF